MSTHTHQGHTTPLASILKVNKRTLNLISAFEEADILAEEGKFSLVQVIELVSWCDEQYRLEVIERAECNTQRYNELLAKRQRLNELRENDDKSDEDVLDI